MAPGEASCWICLEQGPDESGKPLRRDCSCRGDHAGFAHLGCLVKYAESKCTEPAISGEFVLGAFAEHWGVCPNCKQPFQDALALDLSGACVSLAEKGGYKGCQFTYKLKLMEAIHFRIESVLFNYNVIDSMGVYKETNKHIETLLSMVEQILNDMKMKSWVHMPRNSFKFQVYKLLREHFEADSYTQMARLMLSRCDLCFNEEPGMGDKDLKKIRWCYHKARAIFKLLGNHKMIHRVETKIAMLDEVFGSKEEDLTSSVKRARALYEEYIQAEGKDSLITINTGLMLGRILHIARHVIEAERLVTELAAACRQVHGNGHKLTNEAVQQLEDLKRGTRKVLVSMSHNDAIVSFEAVCYVQDAGRFIVLDGPISHPRNFEKEQRVATLSSSVIPHVGCPVVCFGLKNEQSKFNGKIGDLRSPPTFHDGSYYYIVHFEDKNLRPVRIRLENLHVVFELPDGKEARAIK